MNKVNCKLSRRRKLEEFDRKFWIPHSNDPYGREEEVIDIDNDYHIITADDIEYINDGTVDDDLDVWMEMLEDYHENGRII